MTTEEKLKRAITTLKYYAKMEADLRKKYGDKMVSSLIGETKNWAAEALKVIS